MALYRDLQARLPRFATVLVRREAARDVTGEAWLQITRGLHRFIGDLDRFRGWAAKIVHHRAMDLCRADACRPAVPLEPDGDRSEPMSDADTATSALNEVPTEDALALIATFPGEQAQAVLLRPVLGPDARTTGEVLGKRAGTVRVAAHRGLKRLAPRSSLQPLRKAGGPLAYLARHPRRRNDRSAAGAAGTAAEMQGEPAALAAFWSSPHTAPASHDRPSRAAVKTATTIIAAEFIAAIALTAGTAGGVALAAPSVFTHPQTGARGRGTAVIDEVRPFGGTASATAVPGAGPDPATPSADDPTRPDESTGAAGGASPSPRSGAAPTSTARCPALSTISTDDPSSTGSAAGTADSVTTAGNATGTEKPTKRTGKPTAPLGTPTSRPATRNPPRSTNPQGTRSRARTTRPTRMVRVPRKLTTPTTEAALPRKLAPRQTKVKKKRGPWGDSY